MHGKVLEFPADKPLEEISSLHPEYRDLNFEAHKKGLNATMREFTPLLEDSPCPRCKQGKNLCVESITFHGKEIRF